MKKIQNLTEFIKIIKSLNTKLQVIESQFNAIRRSKDPEDKPDKDNLNSVVELKSENQRLKEKLKALSQAKAVRFIINFVSINFKQIIGLDCESETSRQIEKDLYSGFRTTR